MRRLGVCFLLASSLLASATPSSAQSESPWDVWVDTQHCSDTRAGWLAVAKELPAYGWSKMQGAPSSLLFMEAIANMDAVRTSGSFQNYCCKFTVWRLGTSDELSLVRENDVGGNGWIQQPGTPMCAETAILQFGMADPIGALTLPIGSVPGATVTITASGPVSGTGTPVDIPSAPPVRVASPPPPPTQPPSDPIDTIGDITGETGGPTPPGGGGETLPDGIAAQVEGSFTLNCERVDLPSSTYEGYMILNFPGGEAIGAGTVTLVDQQSGQLDFAMQTQLMGSDLGAIGTVQDPGGGISRIELTVTGKLTGATTGTVPASGEVKASIGMKTRFANGRTPGDGSCTARFAT